MEFIREVVLENSHFKKWDEDSVCVSFLPTAVYVNDSVTNGSIKYER